MVAQSFFFEPYIANSTATYSRIQNGYLVRRVRTIPSIGEYTEAVLLGLKKLLHQVRAEFKEDFTYAII